MAQHFYSSVATLSSLAAAATAGATTLTVPAATFLGYPASYPYTIRLEGGTANEELCDVTGTPTVSGGNLILPVTRAIDGSTAKAHASGSLVDHPITARDLAEASAHVYGAAGVHGLPASDVVLGSTDMTVHAGATSGVHGASISVPEVLARCTNTIVLHRGSGTFTTDTSGYMTVTHGAPFTPAHVFVIGRFTGGVSGAMVGVDQITATTFRTRIAGATTVQTIGISWLCIGS